MALSSDHSRASSINEPVTGMRTAVLLPAECMNKGLSLFCLALPPRINFHPQFSLVDKVVMLLRLAPFTPLRLRVANGSK